MHHVVLERWSRRGSVIHSLDARAKLAATLLLLIAIATTSNSAYRAYLAYSALILSIIVAARLPLVSVLLRTALVLPFSAVFAGISWLSGDPGRAVGLVIKSYLSALTVLTMVATTPLPDLLRGLAWFRAPGAIVLVIQFLYRYLFVLSEQAQHMRLAAQSRGSGAKSRTATRSAFEAATGALSTLFARSYARADGIHRAMLARGFSGHFPSLRPATFRLADLLYVLFIAAAVTASRLAI